MASDSSKQALEGRRTVGLVVGATSLDRPELASSSISLRASTGHAQHNEAWNPNAEGDATVSLQSLEEVS